MSNQHNAARKKQSIQNWAAGLTLPFLLAGGMNLATPAFAANDTEAPQEKQEMKNPRIAAIQTEHVKLENGLQALLIHNPNANESAAAMAIGIGGLYEDRPGVMHFSEHMKHTGKYAEFVQANGGVLNAYTTEDHVNYGFTIATYALPEQLSHFSKFFKNPSYDPVHTEKEVEAVDHEYLNSYMDDSNRLNALGKHFSEPGHPYNNFVIGNIDTLKGVTMGELEAIDRAMVSADNLYFVLLSDMPLAEQKKLVVEHFSGIPKFEVKRREISKDFRKPLNGEYRFLQMKPVMDSHYLMLEFPTTSLKADHDNKPHEVLASIIKYPGKGSLLARLKQEGLSLSLDADAEAAHENVNMFEIQIQLTNKGLANYEDVLKITYEYFDFLRKNEVPEYAIQEMKDMAGIDFAWRAPVEGLHHVFDLARTLFEYGLEGIESRPYLIKDHDPAAYKAVLDTLNPANMMVYLVDRNVPVNQQEKYYGTPYSYKTVGGDKFNALANPEKTDTFKYPEPNKFMPGNLALNKEVPHLAVNDEGAQVRFMHDSTFLVPKANMTLKVESPLPQQSARNSILTQLYIAGIEASMIENMAPFKNAGMNFGIAGDSEGINLSFGGYTQHLHEMIDYAAKNLKSITISGTMFEDMKDSMLIDLRNGKLTQADSQALAYGRKLMKEKPHHDSDLEAALVSATLDDVKAFAEQLYAKTFMTGSAYGNWNDSDVQTAVKKLRKGLGAAPLPKSERPSLQIDIPSPGQHPVFSAVVNNNNNAFREYTFLGKATPETEVAMHMVSAMIANDFFVELRTKRQLGYSVGQFSQKLKGELLSAFTIQSGNYEPALLDSETQKWKKEQAIQIVRNMPEAMFEQYKMGLMNQYQSKPNSIEEMHSYLFGAVEEQDGNFNYLEDLQNALQSLTKEQVVAMAEKMLLDESRPAITLHMLSADSKESAAPGAITCDSSAIGVDPALSAWVKNKVCEAPKLK